MIGIGEHDTASAVAAVPADGESFAYICCGTWSLLGTELREPVLTRQAMEWNFTNEGGVEGTYRLLKNIMGLWLIQESARNWIKEGRQRTFAELVGLALEARPFRSLVDPDDASFLNPPHMPEAIRRYCAASGQPVPETEGEIIRCAMESLALKYRYTLEKSRIARRSFFQRSAHGGRRNQQHGVMPIYGERYRQEGHCGTGGGERDRQSADAVQNPWEAAVSAGSSGADQAVLPCHSLRASGAGNMERSVFGV